MSGALLTAQTPDTAAGNAATRVEHLGLGNDVEKLARRSGTTRRRRARAARAMPGTALRIGGFSPVLGPSLPDASRRGRSLRFRTTTSPS